MPHEPPTPASVRSVDDLNAGIRAFWQRLGGRTPSAEERAE
ncbi:hypothetical protein AB0H86_39475 [Streptomyces sp. NPDC050997]